MSVALTPAEAAEARQLIARLGVLLQDREPPAAPPGDQLVTPVVPIGSPRLLIDQDFVDAAGHLSCTVADVHTVDAVESSGRGFGDDGRPIILFEPHVFSRLTNRRFDAGYGGVSYPKWGAKPYPVGQKARWDQLLYAAKLDHAAAYKSASYGRFQVMGFNHAACNYPTVDAFVAAMARGEREHLMAFVQFVLTNRLDDELREHRWDDFATRYNGPGQAAIYAAKLEAAHQKWSTA